MELGTAPTTSTHATAAASEEHLKDIVGVHAAHSSTTTSLIDLFNIGSIVIHLPLLLVREDSVGFSDVFKLGLSFLLLLFRLLTVLIWMPYDRGLPVGLLDLRLACAFVNLKDVVVILSLAFLQFKLCSSHLLTQTLCLRGDIL